MGVELGPVTNARRPGFREVLRVSQERIARLDDLGLNSLMSELLRAQAYRCGTNVSEIRVNTETKAPDDGCDGWSPRPTADDVWLGSSPTCWQFKAGSAGQPRRLRGEVGKRLPREVLKDGGRLVVVASGSTNGVAGERARLRVLKDEARRARLPTRKIEVIGSERLTNWCNQHPAIAAAWGSLPPGLRRLDEWGRSEQHDVPWQAKPDVQATLEQLRNDLDFTSGTLRHVHIQGPPGVGKTRFALELCKGAPWSSAVVYFADGSDSRIAEVISAANSEAGALLMVVADEVQASQLPLLHDSIESGGGRVRLITVGTSETPDPERIPAHRVIPLDRPQMSEVLGALHPAMPPEHVDFVAEFADGYIKLGRLAADAIARNPQADVRALLDLRAIRTVLDKMLGQRARQPLHVVAALTSVGWRGQVQEEGEAIARHLGQNWSDVRAEVERFNRDFGIAPLGGRYRYISPKPLAIYLALEAWEAYPELMQSLPNVLPTEAARKTYYARLETIASNPQAREFARSELGFFFQLDDFLKPGAMQRWAALAAADPVLAAKRLADALATTDVETRRQIPEEVRRTAVWALVRLAWRSQAFHDATMALARLAEAETERWANNATGEFVSRFQVFLGGTALPYLERLKVIDGLTATDNPLLLGLAIKALARVGEDRATRVNTAGLGDEPREVEWHPRTGAEHGACVKQAVGRLTEMAERGVAGIQSELVSAAGELAMLLRAQPVRGVVADFFLKVRERYPDTREALRRTTDTVIQRDLRYWKELSREDIGELEALRSSFEESSLSARLQQLVGEHSFVSEEQPDLSPVAKELVGNPDSFVAEWGWLTSGAAGDGWRLGVAIADADPEGKLAHRFGPLAERGRDLRFLAGYVARLRAKLGSGWFDSWLAVELQRDPNDVHLLFEVSARLGPTGAAVRYMDAALRQGSVAKSLVRLLEFGTWGHEIPDEEFYAFLNTLAGSGHEEVAAAVLAHRLQHGGDGLSGWESTALRLVEMPSLVRAGHMSGYYWGVLARKLLPWRAAEIAEAILREQADKKKNGWFISYSEAEKVLLECGAIDPEGVWNALERHIATPQDALMFAIGFPREVIDKAPPKKVMEWVRQDPAQRAAIVAHMANKDLSSDSTLTAQIIGEFGELEAVRRSFLSNFISGSWMGSASKHWAELAGSLREVAKRTTLSNLRKWAQESASTLDEMAKHDKQREEEEEVRGR